MMSFRTFVFVFTAALVPFAAGCSGSDDKGGSSSGNNGSQKSGKSTSNEDDGRPANNDDEEETDTPSSPKKKANGAQCESSADCESDFCVFRSGGSNLGMCTNTCGSDLDCDLGQVCVQLGDAPQKACVPE